MRVTKPFNLTIDSTNVAASSYPTYSTGTTYNQGDKVSATNADDGLVYEYESVLDSNTGQSLSDEGWWLNLGPCNRDAMFDSRTSTVTTGSGDIVVTVSPGAFFDKVALLNVANSTGITISVYNGATLLYTETSSLTEDVASWFDYFFSPLDVLDTKLISSREVFYGSAAVTVTIAGTNPSIGLLMVGRSTELGQTEYGASVGIEDYSTKETDLWGRTFLLEREYADTADIKMVLPSGQVDYVKRTLANFRATPALYELNNDDSDYQALTIFGKYDDFSVSIDYHSTSYCTLRIVGLI